MSFIVEWVLPAGVAFLLLLLLVVLLLLERVLLVLLERVLLVEIVLVVVASTSSTLVLKQPTQLQMEGGKANTSVERVMKFTTKITYSAL